MDPYPYPPHPPPSSSSATLSPQSPGPSATNTNLNAFRPRRSDDWHEYREIIEQLYRIDQLKLRDVKRIMERDYNFFASEKQYKDRLAAWHVRKNIKAKQVQLMIRKQQKRAARGKQTAFRVNGQEVDSKRIARFVRRYGQSWEKGKDREAESQSPEPSTPSDMTCYTPEPAEESTSTPISPAEITSPTRESSSYPLHYDPTHLDSIPDLEIDDDQHQQQQQTYPLNMHSTQPPPGPQQQQQQQPQQQPHHQPHHQRTYDPIVHSLSHPLPQLHPLPPLHHSNHLTGPPTLPGPGPGPEPGSLYAQSHAHPHPHTQVQPPVQVPVPVRGTPQPTTGRDDPDPNEIISHADNWNRLDAFQNRLEGLQYTLDRTMSKWAREQDPNAEIPHHEGLGM